MLLPLSLQPIASGKNHTVQSNELAKGYTLITMTIFIDKYWRETHTRSYRFFWSMSGAFCHDSLVCALFHTQGSKANSKSNKSLMQKLKQECNAKTKLFWSRRGSFYHNSLVFAMFTPKANCKPNKSLTRGGGVLNNYKNLVNLWASCNSNCFFWSRRGVLNKCPIWYRFFWRKRGGAFWINTKVGQFVGSFVVVHFLFGVGGSVLNKYNFGNALFELIGGVFCHYSLQTCVCNVSYTRL